MKKYISHSELKKMMVKSDCHGFWAIFLTWGPIYLYLFIFSLFPHPLTFVMALLLLSGRQLSLAIMMHDASHFTLFKNQKLNNFFGQWFCALPIGLDLYRYREHHNRHHKFTETEKDPDLDLSQGAPFSKKSFLRKILRDLVGITGIKRIIGVILMEFNLFHYTFAKTLRPNPHFKKELKKNIAIGFLRLGKIFLTNSLFAFFVIQTLGLKVYLLWPLSYLTVYSIIVRIRSLAEHAALGRGFPLQKDPLLRARTTYANSLERMTFAPQNVNFHFEHHLYPQLPSQNFQAFHKLLLSKNFYQQEKIPLEKNYFNVIKKVLL